ncbi:hypothetical protein [Streptomyces auratus]|uniref:Uncharacterized protein n=1 Tax=Streptomyces auratus AGR0001 TaxID=1160718 RepID=J2A325_9ACTN|nr:hypothetical protein [Streptomyces auratus]QTZ94987.1 hypothetical protein SU9_028970 [Streptomyces auratus AGR0001]
MTAWCGGAAVFACGGCPWLGRAVADGLSRGSGAVPAGLPGLVGVLELCTGLVVLCAGAFTLGELTAADGRMPAVEPLPGPPAARCAPPVDLRGNA